MEGENKMMEKILLTGMMGQRVNIEMLPDSSFCLHAYCVCQMLPLPIIQSLPDPFTPIVDNVHVLHKVGRAANMFVN